MIERVGTDRTGERCGGGREAPQPGPADRVRDDGRGVPAGGVRLDHRAAHPGEDVERRGDRAAVGGGTGRAQPLGVAVEPSGDAFMGLDHRIGDGGPPLDGAHRQDREPSRLGQLAQAVGVVALPLAPEPRDAVQMDAGDHALGDRQPLDPLQAVEQAVCVRRVAAGLVPTKPDEARGAVRHRLTQHPPEPLAHLRVEPAGDALRDPALGRDEGTGRRPSPPCSAPARSPGDGAAPPAWTPPARRSSAPPPRPWRASPASPRLRRPRRGGSRRGVEARPNARSASSLRAA